MIDQDHETLIKLRGARFKSYADKFLPPVLFASQFLKQLRDQCAQLSRKGLSAEIGHAVSDRNVLPVDPG